MEYKNKFDFECAECNQKYKLSYNSKEQVEFCPFCGESVLGVESEDFFEEEIEEFEDSDDLDDEY